MNSQAWQLQLALGACRAGRLLAAASMACGLLALAMLACRTGVHSHIARFLWSLVVLAVLPALYLGVRLELDRSLFQRLIDRGDASSESLGGLDKALVARGLRAGDASHRPLAERVGGVLRLVKWLGGVVIVQLGVAWIAAIVR